MIFVDTNVFVIGRQAFTNSPAGSFDLITINQYYPNDRSDPE